MDTLQDQQFVVQHYIEPYIDFELGEERPTILKHLVGTLICSGVHTTVCIITIIPRPVCSVFAITQTGAKYMANGRLDIQVHLRGVQATGVEVVRKLGPILAMSIT